MGKVALDSSVIIGWLIGDSRKLGEDRDVIDQILYHGLEIVAPKLMLLELINILCWRKKVDKLEVMNMIQKVDDLEICWIESNDLDQTDIVNIALKDKLTPYDAWFLQVARQEECQLITHDKALLEADKKCCVTPAVFLKNLS